MRVTTAAGAQWQAGPPGRIMGDARVSLFDIPGDETDLTAMTVDLRDGARASWHSHPCGQILVVISGLGQVQAEGGDVVELGPGDSIWAPPGERHWHGAMPGCDFSYASIQPIDPATGSNVDWRLPWSPRAGTAAPAAAAGGRTGRAAWLA